MTEQKPVVVSTPAPPEPPILMISTPMEAAVDTEDILTNFDPERARTFIRNY